MEKQLVTNGMRPDLIMDVGLHIGRDTQFYLQKGFNVVAIEANPLLAQKVEQELHEYVQSGQLKIYNVAINDYKGTVDFFVNREKHDWGTISKDFATRNEKLGTNNDVNKVPCVPFEEILAECGVPYYAKI